MKMIPLVMANEPGVAQFVNPEHSFLNCSLYKYCQSSARRKSLWKNALERVRIPYRSLAARRSACSLESRTLEMVRKMGGNLLLKLNTDSRPIANKYREGKVKRTLERELKVSEIAEREANETSLFRRDCCRKGEKHCFGTERVGAVFYSYSCCVSCR